ncbi:Rieske (2Fe-2S) protein [Thiocapsa sp. UBA6158]|uniref:Rieske (2Fe-2S) protein n=1 Tax=Thiocapsa sp. UBA6158 TaxID=1947692 RepID=UPI0025E1BF81|nr:Rieske 2Fe-2S domain-containing protein [Thiocapsa sp. UBA6158]
MLFKHEPQSVIVLRHGGRVYADLNQCVHMVRRLDCMHDAVFDAAHEHLRCSMHGIVYDPTTGESLSVLCSGERLKPLRSMEIDGQIYLPATLHQGRDHRRIGPVQGRVEVRGTAHLDDQG